jgi:hypothetical protein
MIKQLKSSRIKSVEYKDSTEVLIVEFVKGGKYKYYAVPEKIYEELIVSESPGRYFDGLIKPNYRFKKA